MSVLGKIGSGLKTLAHAGVRVGTAFVSGGASEAYRAKLGKADPVTAYGERYVDKAGHAINSALTPAGAPGPGSGGAGSDLDAARAYRDKLTSEPDVTPRAAPQVSGPGSVGSAHAAAPSTVSSTFDSTNADQSRATALAHQEYVRSVMEGRAGASAAEIAARRAGAQAISGQYALAGGQQGYSQAGMRAAGRNAAALGQQVVGQVAETRAAEQAQARQEYANLVLGTRGQDITLASAKGAQDLDAQRSNQAAKLQTDLANAGFDQQSLMKMTDQELTAKLANAGFKLTQEQIDDLRSYHQQQQRLAAQGQVLSGGLTQAEIQAKRDEAKARGDAADEAFWGDLFAKFASSGLSNGPGGGAGGTTPAGTPYSSAITDV